MEGMKKSEKRIKAIDTMLSYIGKYEKYKPVYTEYAAMRYFKANLKGKTYYPKELEDERKQLAAALTVKREELEMLPIQMRETVNHKIYQFHPRTDILLNRIGNFPPPTDILFYIYRIFLHCRPPFPFVFLS